MALSVATNTSAATAHRYLRTNDMEASRSLAKLSSGSRIVRASDDAASLAVGTKLKADVAALKQAQVDLALAIQGVIENPGDANWQHLLGAAQFHNGAMNEAVPTLRRAVELAPQNPIAWNTLGAVLVELGEHAQAERALREALRIQADYREAMLNLATLERLEARN